MRSAHERIEELCVQLRTQPIIKLELEPIVGFVLLEVLELALMRVSPQKATTYILRSLADDLTTKLAVGNDIVAALLREERKALRRD